MSHPKRRRATRAAIGAVASAAMVLMKLLPIPGGFEIWEFVALGAWVGLGVGCWLCRDRGAASAL